MRQITRGFKLGLYGVLVLLIALCMVTSLISAVPTVAKNAQVQLSGDSGGLAQLPAGLHVDGVTLRDVSGGRFIAAGLNIETYRDYDNGCGYVTDGLYAIRATMADRIKALGVNIVRLNYANRFLTTANLGRFIEIAVEFASRGIYVMPSDHTYTGQLLSNSSAAYPTMKKIIDAMPAQYRDYLVMNPFNEPGPDVARGDWINAQKNVLTYLRNTAKFDGVVVLDGSGWSTMLDVSAFQQVQGIDAGLRADGKPNVVFSNHLYPNIKDLPPKIWDAANKVPLLIGELGQINPDVSPLDPQYVKNIISTELNAGFANGHNGLFAWIWAWCDGNAMLDDDWTSANGQPSNVPYTVNSPLTSHGTLWRDNYYSKLPNSNVPPPATVIVQQPSRTPTRTILPTNSPRPPTRTPTEPVVVIITNTPEPPPAGCVATMVEDVVFNGKPAKKAICITYN